MKVGIVSLGCPKNLTDTEVILGKLAAAGHEITNNERDADVLIINTCAFIKPAIDEAMSEIKRAIKLKQKGHIKYLVVAGCLPQRQKIKMADVDAWVGSGNIDKIVDVVKNLGRSPRFPIPDTRSPSQRSCLFDHKTPRIKATPRHYAYIKIADGCDNRCTYCTVPNIRGPFKSRPTEDIVAEAKILARSGTKELILVAQDTTNYGTDLYSKLMLPALLKKLCRIPGLKWIRIMYAHPDHMTDELIKVIAKEKKIVKYIDLPIQHICDNILKLMGRRVSKRKIIDLIAKIRRSIPAITIRTTFIVGFPGETRSDFKELLDFIKKERFERLGIFAYSAEEGTPAANLRGKLPETVKISRFRQAMRLQNQISKKLNEEKRNKVFEVLVDSKAGKGFIGRTASDAPEIDGSVVISPPYGGHIKVGDFVSVKVKRASAYDLFGALIT